MFRYLKEAFFVRARVPLLGGVPVNVLLSIAFAILGIAHPGFWLLGAGVVGGFVLMLASSPRFQKVIQARDLEGKDRDTRSLESSLIAQLPGSSRDRLADLDTRCARVLAAYMRAEVDEYTLESSRDALQKLRWLYLKLLVAHNTLCNADVEAQAQQIKSELAEVDRDLRSEKMSPAAKASREVTRDILVKRTANLERRRHSVQEVESDLERIDAQIDLALDEATLKGQPVTIATNIDLASQLLDSGVFGASERIIMDLDERMSAKTAPAAPVTVMPQPAAEQQPQVTPSAPPPKTQGTSSPPALPQTETE